MATFSPTDPPPVPAAIAMFVENKELLFRAIGEGDADEVRRLVTDGASVEVGDDSSGHSPMSYAAMLQKNEVIKVLIEEGADVNGASGRTPPIRSRADGNSRRPRTCARMAP